MKLIKLLFVFVLSVVTTSCFSQLPLLPKQSTPSPRSKGYSEIGYTLFDSAILFTSRDTLWRPKKYALVFWKHTGVDTTFWYWDMVKWQKLGLNGGVGNVIWSQGFPTYDARYSPLNHTQAFSTITGKPTTLTGYGITDPVIVSSGSYSNPSWISSLSWSKINSRPSTLAGYGITDPIVVSSGSYSNPSWISSLDWSKVTSRPTTTAGYGITDALAISTADLRYPQLSSVYSNPSWISAIVWGKVTLTPTTLAGYGITDPVALTNTAYANPAWISSLAWSKITSRPTTLAGYGITDPIALTSATYSNPTWINSLTWSKITGTPTTTAGYGITDALALSTADTRYPQLSGTYANPAWISSLAWSKITSTPTTLAGYNISDGITLATADTRYALTSSVYSNPSWINTLAWSKIVSTPTTISGYGITDGLTTAGGDAKYPQLANIYSNPSWVGSLGWSKITSTPTTMSGYGITDGLALSTADTRYPLVSNFYNDPSWITGLDWSKLTGTPVAIQNQNASAQTGNFWINGNGYMGTVTTGDIAIIGYGEIHDDANKTWVLFNNSGTLGLNGDDGINFNAGSAMSMSILPDGTFDISGFDKVNLLSVPTYSSGGYNVGVINSTNHLLQWIPKDSLSLPESDPTVDAIIKSMPVTTDATTNKFYYWNNGSIGRRILAAGDIPNITESQVTNLTTDLAAKASLSSPTFTGTVTIPNGSVLGTPTSINLANATFPTLNQNTTGSAASFTGNLVGDVTGTQGATIVGKINGVSLSGLTTGILKNTTTTGVPSIAVAGTDYALPNANTTGSAGSVSGTNVITNTNFRQSAALSVIGRSANTIGNIADITATNDGDVLRRSGTSIGFGTIPESSVTNLIADLAAKQDTGITTNIIVKSPLYNLNDTTLAVKFVDRALRDSGVITPEMADTWDNKQDSLQFQDEGSNLGTTGTVTTINYTGTGVTATRTGDAVTVNISGGGSSESAEYSKNTYYAVPNTGITNVYMKGFGNNALSSTNGTATARSIANTSIQTALPRLGYVTAGAAVNERAGYRVTNPFWIGNASGLGGFDIIGRQAFPQIVTNRTIYMGLMVSLSGFAGNVQPSTLANMVGIGVDSTDTNWQLMNNDASGACTKTDTGIPVSTTDICSLRISIASNGTAFSVTFTTSSGGSYTNTNVNTNIPSNDQFFTYFVQNQSNGTAQVISTDFYGIYAETPINF